ncbi:MAG: outer membrane protein assembly factor BamD [Rhizobiales bacterium]|nr:outer membrane protein assembly factor BamD [Hyphomicrobiales bacterium]
MGAAGEDDAVAKLYNKGLGKLQGQQYISAVKAFAEVERQYPYSAWATKALIMQAYANYYLIALSDYNRINDTRRDQTTTQKALNELEEIERRFPGTAYAEDAGRKAIMAKDHLAGKEMEVGRYYYAQGSYLAGINRFKKVVTDYQNTSQTPEALYRLTEGYMALGVVSEARTAAAVLGQNFPNSQWYKDAYTLVASDGQAPVENQESWISKAFRAINPL